MDRRTFFRTSTGVGAAALLTGVAGQAAHASGTSVSPEDLEKDPLAFVEDGMSTQDVADLLFEGHPEEKRIYLAKVEKFPDQSPREQLRSVLSGRQAPSASDPEIVPAAVPVVVAIAGRALIAAAKRYGPAMYRGLKNAVSRGYGAFNQWTKDNPFAAGIIAGVGGSALYDWLKENL